MIGRGPKFLGEEAEPVERNWDSTLEIGKIGGFGGRGGEENISPYGLCLRVSGEVGSR